MVVSEGIQTILTKNGIHNGYEVLKNFSRNYDIIDKCAVHEFIDILPVTR